MSSLLNHKWVIYRDPLTQNEPVLELKDHIIEYDPIDGIWFCALCQKILFAKSIYESVAHNCLERQSAILGQGSLFSKKLDYSYTRRLDKPMRPLGIGEFSRFVFPLIRGKFSTACY